MTFPSRNLDLHRLHECIRKLERGGSSFFRGQGQTTARLYLMKGEIELGDAGNQYLFVAENSISKQMVVRDFVELIADVHPDLFEQMKKAKDDWYPDTIVTPQATVDTPQGQTFHFASLSQTFHFVSVDTLINNPNFVRGVRYAKVFFDVSYEKQSALDKHGRLTEALIVLEATGTEFV